MIYLAADHRGFKLKEAIKKALIKRGAAVDPVRSQTPQASASPLADSTSNGVEDMGALAYDAADDYVDFAVAAARKIAENPSVHKGIFICGSGHGVDMVANKFRGVRAALCWNTREAEQSRRDDDANVLVLAADACDDAQAKEIVSVWLGTTFSGEDRHIRRLQKVEEIERKNFN